MHPPSPTGDPLLTDRAFLTDEGWRWLEARAAGLRERLEAARCGIEEDPDSWESDLATISQTEGELRAIEWTLRRAVSIHELPDDPNLVQVGDSVQVRFEGGDHETYVVVHVAEASLDDARVSTESPLGRALLARVVGESVEVTTPNGSYTCTVVSATRHHRDGRAN